MDRCVGAGPRGQRGPQERREASTGSTGGAGPPAAAWSPGMRGVLPQHRPWAPTDAQPFLVRAGSTKRSSDASLRSQRRSCAARVPAHGSAVAGCAATPSRRPLKTTPITSGEGTTEAIRKQLEGTWSLTSFSVFDAAGKPTVVEASGALPTTRTATSTCRARSTTRPPRAAAPRPSTSRAGRSSTPVGAGSSSPMSWATWTRRRCRRTWASTRSVITLRGDTLLTRDP